MKVGWLTSQLVRAKARLIIQEKGGWRARVSGGNSLRWQRRVALSVNRVLRLIGPCDHEGVHRCDGGELLRDA